MADDIELQVHCPRCGHDQRGRFPADGAAWPLRSECSECGLPIDWSYYMLVERTLPRWMWEHARWRRLPLALPLTIVMTLAPRTLWRVVRMEHPVRSVRLTLLAIVAVALVFASLAWIVGTVAWSRQAQALGVPLTRLVNLSFTAANGSPVLFTETADSPTFAQLLSGPLRIAMTPWSNQWVAVGATRTTLDPAWMQAAASDPNLPPGPPKIVHAPIQSLQGGSLTIASPKQVWRDVLRLHSSRTVVHALLAAFLSVLAFLVLPIARRRAKVRWLHVVRCSVYLAIAATAIAVPLRMSLAAVGRFAWEFEYIWTDWCSFAIVGCLLTLWWRFAAGDYLKMQRPWAVAASVGAIGALGAAAITLVR